MKRRLNLRRRSAALLTAAAIITVSLGLDCPNQGNGAFSLNPDIVSGNRAPRILITSVDTPQGGSFAEQGDNVSIFFSGEDTEDEANVRIFASTSADPNAGDQIPILSDFKIGPGPRSGTAFWDTTVVVPASYNIFAEIDDGTLARDPVNGNPPVVVTFRELLLVGPKGTGPETGSPTLQIDLPAADAGLSNKDLLTIRFSVKDPNSDADTLTLKYFLDKDNNASNDNIDPPLEVGTDTIPAGSLPPDTFEFPPRQVDIEIDLNDLPIRSETDEAGRPLSYFVRVQVDDGTGNVVNEYAAGKVRLLSATSDVVDLLKVGGTSAGATFQGFDGFPDDPERGSRAGSAITPLGDLDNDGLADFAIAAETASPFNVPRVGEVYVIYGRERRLDPNVARLLEFKTGRYAGVISLNSVGSFVPFPPNDPRHETIFNIRGSIIPQMSPLGLGDSMGITDLAGLPDITNDGLPELLVGAPLNYTLPDLEDDDPCDTCTFTTMEAAPFDCLIPVLPPKVGDNAFESEVVGVSMVNGVMAGTWVPVDPMNLANAPFNIDLEMGDERILGSAQDFVRFEFIFSGQRTDQLPAPIMVTVHFEDELGPEIVLKVDPADDPALDDMGMFSDVNGTMMIPDGNGGMVETPLIPVDGFPVGPDGLLSPSVYDGQFKVTMNPDTGVDFDMVQMRVHAFTGTPETHPIRFTYFDGFPGRFSNTAGCTNIAPAPVNPIAMEDFKPACPPVNRTPTPLITTALRRVLPLNTPINTYGNRDGHECSDSQVAAATGAEDGTANDDVGSTGSPDFYESGHVFVLGSDDLVLPLNTGRDDDNDGVFDDGPFGTWTGTGFRVAPMRLFGQPPYLRQGGLGMRGARFRGAWYQPDQIYDPFSLFGYSVDVMPDINAFGFTDTELLISAPAGGTFVSIGPLENADMDLTDNLMGTFDNAGITSATSVFNTGTQFGKVLDATLSITGVATNVAVLRVGLDILGEDGNPVPDGKPDPLFSRDVLLWNGAGPQTLMDTPSFLEYDEFFGDTVTFDINSISVSLPQAALPLMLSGNGTLAVEVLPDCVVENSQVVINSALLTVTGLEAEAGYIKVMDGTDYTRSAANLCQFTDGDPETDEDRPMSWPSTGCNTINQPRTRDYCFHPELVTLLAEDAFDALGWARNAGDLNRDGVADIICGAPGNDNDPDNPDFNCMNELGALSNNGKIYLIYGTPTLNNGGSIRPCELERFEIRGTHNDDQFGRVQGIAGDMNGDTFDDVFFAAEGYDAAGSILGIPDLGTDVGFVGVLFGLSSSNGILSIRPEQVGTDDFPGCKFIGGSSGARLGGGAPGNPTQFATEKGQHGVSSAGDFNLDGFEDLLITAPGQEWPGVSIEFTGPISEGDSVTINGRTFEFDTNGVVTQGAVPLAITSFAALDAQSALFSQLGVTDAETLNIASITSRTEFPNPLPDNPTITVLARRPSDLPSGGLASVVSKSGASIKLEFFTRMGATYLVFGDNILLENRQFVLPDDLNRRDTSGNRVLKGVVFVSAYEKNTGPDDLTQDEAPVEVVSSVGDIDGDGFVDIILGAPQADFINILAPQDRRQSSGEAYLIYGNQFGLNNATAP